MERAEHERLGRKILDYIAAGKVVTVDELYRNPIADYTCAKQAAREKEIFFGRDPLLVGLSADLPENGSYLTNDYTGVPILAVRGKDGVVRAFLNVCRHRGTKVAQGCGKTQGSFSCPYHAWTYASDGKLIAIPDAPSFAGIDRAAHGLRELPVAEKHGLIWVRPSPGPAIEPDALLDTLMPEIAAYKIGSYHHYETRILRKMMNWKLVLDTFLEGYHIPVLHRDTIAEILPARGAQFDAFGRNLRFIIPRNTFPQLREQPQSQWDVVRHSAIVYILFPNVAFIAQGDHLETWRVYPVGTDESVMEVSLYTPEPALSDKARRHWDRNMDLLMDTVEKEDFPLGEDIQRGFRSGAQDHIIFGRNEPSLHHFHRSIRNALDAA